MPALRIVSWNSTGENALKAGEIQAVQGPLAGLYPVHPQVDVCLVQEAVNGGGGAIRQMFDTDPPGPLPAPQVTLGPNYHRPCDHLAELPGGGGAAYLASFHANLGIGQHLTHWNYGTDVAVQNWINNLPLNQQAAALAATAHRPPVYATLTAPGGGGPMPAPLNVVLITWHAPLGGSLMVPPLGWLPGGALPDAYFALESSNLLPWAANQVAAGNGVVIIAGDLNMTAAGLATPYFPGGPTPLANFAGVTHHLDHILAWRPAGGGVNVIEGHDSPSTSVHNLLSARVVW